MPPRSQTNRRGRIQFSLRMLLGLIVVASLGFGWLGMEMGRARRREASLGAIRRAGGQIRFDDQARTVGPEWLGQVMGVESITRVGSVTFFYPHLADDHIQHLRTFPELEELFINDGAITNHGLEVLSQLPELRQLRIWKTKITGQGLAPLRNLAHLTELELSSLYLGNEGAAALAELPSLRLLDLHGARLTDAELGRLAPCLRNLEVLNLSTTHITDESVPLLLQLDRLELLNVSGSQVTKQGERRLEQGLPKCRLLWWQGRYSASRGQSSSAD